MAGFAYTYLIKCVPENTFYYGVRYAKGCRTSDLWNTYFTSSKKVKSLINKYGVEAFEHEIRKTFNSVSKAREWEEKVLKKLDVINDERFINQTDNRSIAPEAAAKSMKGKFGKDHNRFGEKNSFLSEYNKNNVKIGKLNGMFGRTGKNHPAYGRRGELSPIFGRPRDDLRETVQCPHCAKRGNIPNMKRWHFDNCKSLNK